MHSRRRRESAEFKASDFVRVNGEHHNEDCQTEVGTEACADNNEKMLRIARNAWRVQKENGSLRLIIHQQKHEIACISAALKVKKEQLFRTEKVLGEERKKGRALLKRNQLLTEKCRLYDTDVLPQDSIEEASSSNDKDVVESVGGLEEINEESEQSLDLLDSSSEDLSFVLDFNAETPQDFQSTRRRRSTGKVNYKEPSLRSKLRQGFENTFDFGMENSTKDLHKDENKKREKSRRRKSSSI